MTSSDEWMFITLLKWAPEGQILTFFAIDLPPASSVFFCCCFPSLYHWVVFTKDGSSLSPLPSSHVAEATGIKGWIKEQVPSNFFPPPNFLSHRLSVWLHRITLLHPLLHLLSFCHLTLMRRVLHPGSTFFIN